MQVKKSMFGFALPLIALSNNKDQGSFSIANKAIRAECASKAEEEAAELEKILQSQNGGMPVDPEEMQQMLAAARNKGKEKPPPFMAMMAPLRTLTSYSKNNGFTFGFGVPVT